MMEPWCLLLVVPSRLPREGLKAVLERSGATIREASSAQQFLQSDDTACPDLVIWGAGISLKSLAADIGAIRTRFARAQTSTRLIVLTNEFGTAFARHIAVHNIDALLHDDISGEVFVKSIELVMLGQRMFPGLQRRGHALLQAEVVPFPSTPKRFVSVPAPQPQAVVLTQRETEILGQLVDGASNKAIALRLNITDATVKVHVRALLRKIRASNRTQAATWALNNRYEVAESPNATLRTADTR